MIGGMSGGGLFDRIAMATSNNITAIKKYLAAKVQYLLRTWCYHDDLSTKQGRIYLCMLLSHRSVVVVVENLKDKQIFEISNRLITWLIFEKLEEIMDLFC